MTQHNAGNVAISQLWNALCTSMKAQIPLERANYQPPQYVDYNLVPLNVYEYQLHNMLVFK